MGRTIRIFLADGDVAGIRHAEIVNWTGQALALDVEDDEAKAFRASLIES
jgi:hypothetical protein